MKIKQIMKKMDWFEYKGGAGFAAFAIAGVAIAFAAAAAVSVASVAAGIVLGAAAVSIAGATILGVGGDGNCSAGLGMLTVALPSLLAGLGLSKLEIDKQPEAEASAIETKAESVSTEHSFYEMKTSSFEAASLSSLSLRNSFGGVEPVTVQTAGELKLQSVPVPRLLAA